MNAINLLSRKTTLASNLWFVRALHANRASVARIRRAPGNFTRQYPTKLVYKDGSTTTFRHTVPRDIIKLPFLLEQCGNEAERKAWLARRKPIEVMEIKKDDTAVHFDQKQYLAFMQQKKKRTN